MVVLELTHGIKLTDISQGMPRILLSTAHLAPLILDALGMKYYTPSLVAPYPPLPKPFQATAEHISSLQNIDAAAKFEQYAEECLESAQKSFCNDVRSHPKAGCRLIFIQTWICDLPPGQGYTYIVK